MDLIKQKRFNIILFLESTLFYLLLLKKGIAMLKRIFQYKRSVFTFLLVVLSSLTYSQHIVKGTVSDKAGIPIQYAYISTKANKKMGVVSNEAGYFQISTNGNLDDSLFVTHIGFNSTSSFLNQKKSFYEIKLEYKDIMLNGVSITVFKQDDLIKRIKKNIPINYPNFNSVQEAYFNYEVKNENLLLGYFDGNLNLDIQSYGNMKSHLKQRLLNVNLNVNNFKKISNFYYTSAGQILSYIFPLNLPFLMEDADYKYTIEKFENNTLPYYKVYFEPRNEQKKWVYSGEFFVDAGNYAITEAKFHLVKNSQNKDASINIGFSTSKTITSTNSENIVVKYQSSNGLYFNNFIKYASEVVFYDSKINSTRNITINAVNMTTSFNINPTKEETKAGESFNLFTLKTQKRERKLDKNIYLGIDWEDKIKKIKEENPELEN